jgi:hypothetical protein
VCDCVTALSSDVSVGSSTRPSGRDDPRPRLEVSAHFDEVLRTEGTKIIKTPIRAPKANAFDERWVRTAGCESPDHLLFLGRCNFERVLQEFATHYNADRSHRASGWRTGAGDARGQHRRRRESS